jgi:hypothetical protein
MDLEMQFFDFFGDKQGRVDDRDGLIDKIKPEDQNIMKIRNSEVIKYSRAFGITAYELSDRSVDDVKEKMKQALAKKDNAKVKKLAYRQTILNKAAEYRRSVLDPAFEVLKTLVLSPYRYKEGLSWKKASPTRPLVSQSEEFRMQSTFKQRSMRCTLQQNCSWIALIMKQHAIR